jgi:FtsZ-binding cell division protein ZapB
MIFTGIMAVIIAGIIIGILWMKNRELKDENAKLQGKYEDLKQRHTDLLLSRTENVKEDNKWVSH